MQDGENQREREREKGIEREKSRKQAHNKGQWPDRKVNKGTNVLQMGERSG